MTDAATRVALEPLGERALVVRFGNGIDIAINARVHAAAAALAAAHLPGVLDIVPAYATLALDYDPCAWIARGEPPPAQRFADAVRAILAAPTREFSTSAEAVEIPVAYGGAHGPDLDAVAALCGLAADEVVARHVAADYRVAMIGFAPGFPYLLGLDPKLVVPRRASPRVRVPAGSVAIGGAQTGVYPSELPGGWQLIGRTPLALFDATRSPPSLLAAGTRVRLRAIDTRELDALARERAS